MQAAMEGADAPHDPVLGAIADSVDIHKFYRYCHPSLVVQRYTPILFVLHYKQQGFGCEGGVKASKNVGIKSDSHWRPCACRRIDTYVVIEHTIFWQTSLWHIP